MKIGNKIFEPSEKIYVMGILNVTPDSVENEYYYTGFASYGARQKVSPISVIGYAFKEVGYSVNTVVKSLGMMFTGQVGINDLSGPVGTVSAMSNIVEELSLIHI